MVPPIQEIIQSHTGDHTEPYRASLIQSHTRPHSNRATMQYHTEPYKIIQYHIEPYKIIQYHTEPYRIIQFYIEPLNHTVIQVIRPIVHCYTVQCIAQSHCVPLTYTTLVSHTDPIQQNNAIQGFAATYTDIEIIQTYRPYSAMKRDMDEICCARIMLPRPVDLSQRKLGTTHSFISTALY